MAKPEKATKGGSTKAKKKRVVSIGIVKVLATFNNTKITVTDEEGRVLDWGSAGQEFKGSRKSTPHAATETARKVAERVKEQYGMRKVYVEVRGPGTGRDGAVKSTVAVFGAGVISIADKTGEPHNGCRAENERRV